MGEITARAYLREASVRDLIDILKSMKRHPTPPHLVQMVKLEAFDRMLEAL